MLKLFWVPDCQHAKKLVSNSPGLGGSGRWASEVFWGIQINDEL